MDESHKSRTSDAAAVRKRRSSILKSQRAPRTPLSELEFHVATPTDTGRSRRVSFSRRTGVAEFVTNEATTTWKNFYEEHNKSLESSGNDSEMNARRPHIGHIGKRIFDDQFEEVEVVELMQNLNNPAGFNINSSINFTQQLASLECTGDDRKLSAPLSKFELSTFTDHPSKNFGDELRVQSLCEMSAGINVNFSAIQTIQPQDDLDEIQRDLERAHTNSRDRHRSFIANENLSEYIEIDLNTTRIATDDIDMSVTDTVPSPKVEDIPKSCYNDKKLNISKDWMADKENIAIDPYAPPRESANFAINQESDKVLVFDGKRLTLQLEKEDSQNYRKTLLPNVHIEQVPKWKTMVLDTDDDLPNFIEDFQVSKTEAFKCQEKKEKLIHSNQDLANMSTTRAVLSNLIIPGESDNCKIEKTVVYGDDTGNISITQAFPVNIVYNEKCNKRRTILYEADSADISVTKAVSSNIMLLDKADVILPKSSNTTVFDTDNCDISMTQALPANIIFEKVLEKRKTILYENDTEDISMTQAVTGNIIQEAACGKIVGDENDPTNKSIIQRSTRVVCDNNFRGITQTTSDEVQHRKTNICGNTVAQTLLTNNILSEEKAQDKSKCDDFAEIQITNLKDIYESQNTNKITSFVGEQDLEKVSQDKSNIANDDSSNIKQKERRKTIVYENGADISITCAIPTNVVLAGNSVTVCKKRQTIVFDDNFDISMTEALPCNLLLETNEIDTFKQPPKADDTLKPEKAGGTTQKTFLLENVDIVYKEPAHEKLVEDNKRLGFENDIEMSITEPIAQISNKGITTKNTSVFQNDFDVLSTMRKSYTSQSLSLNIEPIIKEQESLHDKTTIHSKQNVIVYQTETSHLHSASKLQSKKTDQIINSECKDQVTTSIPNLVHNYANETKSLQIDNKNGNEEIISNNKERFEKEYLDMSLDCEVASESDHSIIPKENGNAKAGNKSVLDDLLDMSTTSMEEVLDDKNVVIKIQSEEQFADNKNNEGVIKESNESMFYIMKDDEEETQTEKFVLASSEKKVDNINKDLEKNTQLKDQSPLKLEYVEESPRIVNNIQKKLDEIKDILQNKESSPKNRHYEKILSSNIDSEEMNREDSPKKFINVSNVRKSIKNADDTNDLLQMLSEFTDNKVSDYIEEDEEIPEPTMVNGHIALENKSEIKDTKGTSFIPKRRISREELNNISQAQGVLQKPRFDLDVTENFENIDTQFPDTKSPIRKSVRMSNEVVKTLKFEEDTDSEMSIISDKVSPLKKTAFGETSYMKESKAKVIPTYLKDVSEEIKELMHDLVKPTADTKPFETSGLDKNLKNIPSTCSTQIQANLYTSSQIDVHTELYSNPPSTHELNKQILATSDQELTPHESKSPIKLLTTIASEKSVEAELVSGSHVKQNAYQKTIKQDQTSPERVLVFDHLNPLNNVLLAPLNNHEAHKYNPITSNETLCGSQHSNAVQISINEKDNAFEVERVSVHYNIENRVALKRLSQPPRDVCFDKNRDTQSVLSISSKAMSLDQSTDVKMAEIKDVDVNTVISMKDNKALLEASSSLTLVDDALTHSKDSIQHEIQKTKSPVKVVYQTEIPKIPEKMDSDVIIIDDEPDQKKPAKRSYSPTKRDKQKQTNLDITPKPISKMQKLSNSPNVLQTLPDTHQGSPERDKLTVEKDEKSTIQDKNAPIAIDSNDENITINNTSSDEDKKRTLRRSKANKTGTIITVQQFITDYNMDANRYGDKIEALNVSNSDMCSEIPKTESKHDVEDIKSGFSSFTSSKNLNEDRKIVLESQQTSKSSIRSTACLNSCPELVNELSSKSLISECESSANVIAKIDALPFMGSRECEWEMSERDVWTFLLLHSRVRLTVRFGHRRGNAFRTYVRADTPVNALALEIAQYDKKNSVASACVGFAAEAMRYLCGRCSGAGPEGAGLGARAGDVPALVRRCGAVARVALRWGRAMYDAELRLAYTITDDGLLTLKVANVPLRSVWEVRMRVELVVGDAREAPWPRASHLRVVSLLEERHLPEREVQRAVAHVPHDWGHVPRTLWRIFKYLKNKTRDETLLCV